MKPLFSGTVPKDNILRDPPGTFRVVTDGFFVFLEPLPPGNHDLRLTTSVSNPIELQFNYASAGLKQLVTDSILLSMSESISLLHVTTAFTLLESKQVMYKHVLFM